MMKNKNGYGIDRAAWLEGGLDSSWISCDHRIQWNLVGVTRKRQVNKI